MKRTKLADRAMPDYSQGEELWNTVSHLVGAGLGVVALVWCLILSNTPMEIVTSIVYAMTMILLYTTSGTYTIVVLVSIRPEDAAVAWVVFAIEWAMAAIAVTLTAIDLQRYRHFSLACYIIMGWAGVIAVKPAIRALGAAGCVLLLAGGISYTVGSVLYMIGKKKQYYHSVFHVFILLGSLLHFFCIVFIVL